MARQPDIQCFLDLDVQDNDTGKPLIKVKFIHRINTTTTWIINWTITKGFIWGFENNREL